MLKVFRQLFELPDPLAIAGKELRMSQLALLEAQGAQEAAAGHVQVLQARIKRLQTAVESYSKAADAGN